MLPAAVCVNAPVITALTVTPEAGVQLRTVADTASEYDDVLAKVLHDNALALTKPV